MNLKICISLLSEKKTEIFNEIQNNQVEKTFFLSFQMILMFWFIGELVGPLALTFIFDLELAGEWQFPIIGIHVDPTSSKNQDQDCKWSHNNGMLPWGLFDAFKDLIHLGRRLGFPWLRRTGPVGLVAVMNHLDQFFFRSLKFSCWCFEGSETDWQFPRIWNFF